jgi:ankyrin repeat protein
VQRGLPAELFARCGRVDRGAVARSSGAEEELLGLGELQNGRLDVVMKLISAGADVNKAATNDGATPLLAAVLQGHLAVVTKLIAAGADVDKATTDWGCTPLIIAAENGQLTVATKLIAAGADVNKAATDDGSTPLFFAASFGWTAIVLELLQHGADKSITGSNHETPLWSAEVGGYPAIVALLS